MFHVRTPAKITARNSSDNFLLSFCKFKDFLISSFKCFDREIAFFQGLYKPDKFAEDSMNSKRKVAIKF